MRLIILLLFVCCAPVFAQKQKGQVVESSVTSSARTGLEGVKITLRGNGNCYITNSLGFFTMSMHSYNKAGIPYYLTDVYKKGYELADPSLIGRPMAYSSKEMVSISLLSSERLQAEKTRIEQNVYHSACDHFNKSLTALKDSLDKALITTESYRQKYNVLQERFERYKPLISVLADHYARIDYSSLSEHEVTVCEKIKQGEFDRADSLLTAIELELNRRLEIHKRKKQDVANDLYNKYAIALSRFDSKKAAEYIYLRADVDSTDIKCLIDAGAFACEYASDYIKSAFYYDKALIQAEEQFGTFSEQYALCLNHKGGLLLEQSLFEESLQCREKALQIRIELFGELHASVAGCYNNIANIYYAISDLTKAKEYAEKAVYIFLNIENSIPSEHAAALNTLGGVSLALGDIEFASTLFDDAIQICDEHYGPENVHSATALNDKGVVLDYLDKNEDAINCYRRALRIYQKVYGTEHPTVATLYDNLGNSFKNIGQMDSAMVYMSQALELRLDLYGEFHEDVAISLNNLGSLFSANKMYDYAIDFYGKSLSIWEIIMGKNHSHFATTLGNMGVLYYRQKNHDMALSCFEESLEYYISKPQQYKKELKSIGSLAAICYNNLLQDESATYHKQLKEDFEEFKKTYSEYILN